MGARLVQRVDIGTTTRHAYLPKNEERAEASDTMEQRPENVQRKNREKPTTANRKIEAGWRVDIKIEIPPTATKRQHRRDLRSDKELQLSALDSKSVGMTTAAPLSTAYALPRGENSPFQ